MSKKFIIHISDLHVSLNKSDDGKILDKSHLNTSGSDLVKSYIADFVEYLNKFKVSNSVDEYKLIISGDIANASEVSEYGLALELISEVKSKVGLTNEDILMIPGNHDVNRHLNKVAFDNGEGSQLPHLYHEEKFTNYIEFHKKAIEREFNPRKAVLDTLIFEDEKLILVGINSNFKVSHCSGIGFIDIDQLKSDLDVSLGATYEEFSKIAVFHHNFISYYEDSVHGQFEVDNLKAVKQILLQNGFKAVMFGHEHTKGTEKRIDNRGEISYIGAGSLSQKGIVPTFDIIEVQFNQEKNELALIKDNIRLNCDNSNEEPEYGVWVKQNRDDLTELTYVKIRESGQVEVEPRPLVRPTAESEIIEGDQIVSSEAIEYPLNSYEEAIFQVVQKNKLFKSGHFHWSDNSKAHNWIDMPKLLSEIENINLAQKAIIDSIFKNSIEFDFIIGLGIEGNILSTQIALYYNKPYSYLPYSYRYEDHADYEMELKTDNENYKKVLIITDVVHDGKTIRNLMRIESEFFSNELVDEVSIVSLFYTGDNAYDVSQINKDDETRIKFYYVTKMKVEPCHYGADFRETCMIYKEKLACVHEFYDAERAKSKITPSN